MDQHATSSGKKSIPQPIRKPAPACVLVIFGITGDLTKRLLYPSICNLGSSGLLNENFHIVGLAREDYNDESFREQLNKYVGQFVKNPAAKEYGHNLANRVYYISGDFADENLYTKLKNKLDNLATEEHASKNYLFYFATLPQFVETITLELNKAKLLSEEENKYFRRIVVEKPFGYDLQSAKKLNQLLLSVVEEDQIFRIDHFLGKETVQNILAFRFSNGLFEPIWNRLYVDNVQITVAEKIGIELRGNFYEHAGALRDMVPNHLFQMLSLITMEPPSSFSAHCIQAEKTNALQAVQIPTPEQVLARTVRGQYGPGQINNVNVVGYREEKNVAPDSAVETFVALELFIDNWRWLGVPFYLLTGKCLPKRRSEIIIQFKSGPSTLFNEAKKLHGSENKIMPNLLHIFIQPEEGISLQFNTKIPGPSLALDQVEMKFKYSDYFGVELKTGYEMILYDCMNGEHLLFKQADIVEAGWRVVQPILDVWHAIYPQNFPNYAAGTWGPKEAHALLRKNGRKWLL